MTGLRLRQNLKLKDTDLESLSYQGFGVAMQLLKHREDAMDVVQDSLRKLVHGRKYNGKLGKCGEEDQIVNFGKVWMVVILGPI